MPDSIAINIAELLQQIRAAEHRFARQPNSVTLMAVSKTRPAEAVREAYQAGLRHIGENYLQEALDKIEALPDLDIVWHFIGPIQSNKTRPIAEHFAWVHSVDRLKVARRLSEQRPVELPPLNICLQVNISGEASKSGVTPAELPEIAAEVAKLPNIQLRGLMAIPASSDQFEAQREPFRQLRELQEQLNQQGLKLDTLSMGMSGDMQAAIAEGATMVRIGTDIFGARAAKTA